MSDSKPDPSETPANEKAQERPIVLILGLTGAGKTTFLNHVAGSNLPVAMKNDMNACTANTQTAIASIGEVEVLLVDTPGFDDPNRSEARILIDVAEWIKNNLRGQRKVTAALYLHSIETTKMYGSNLRNFHLFANLVGSNSMKNMGLVTTHWDKAAMEDALSRESQLSAQAWSMYLRHGARTYRADNSRSSCRAIVRQLLELQPTFLQIQEEMTRGRKQLRDTEAGKHVIKEVEQRIQEEKEYIAELKKRAAVVIGDEKVDIEKLIGESKTKLKQYLEDLEQVKHIPGWGEAAVDLLKTQGPQLAFTLASVAVGRSVANAAGANTAVANAAVAGLQSQVTILVKENGLLREAAAKAAEVVSSSNSFGQNAARGAGFAGTYWGLERAYDVAKWALPKIAQALF